MFLINIVKYKISHTKVLNMLPSIGHTPELKYTHSMGVFKGIAAVKSDVIFKSRTVKSGTGLHIIDRLSSSNRRASATKIS